MFKDIFDIILFSAEGAFLQVGVFVGAVLLIFGMINYKKQGKFVEAIEESKRYQPIIGAFLGLTPGCGGAIFVMPLYLKGTVTFGTVIATLIATMGDAAFVIISTMPLQYLWVSVLSFATAIVTGYMIDYLNIGEGLIKDINKKIKNTKIDTLERHLESEHGCVACKVNDELRQHIGHEEGDKIDIILHHNEKSTNRDGFAYKFTHYYAYKFYWAITAIGLVLGILLLFQVDVNVDLGIPNLGFIIGIGGTLFSIIYMIIDKKFLKDDSHEEEEHKIFSLRETLIHNAEETAFASTWVFVAYVVYELAVHFVGGEQIVESWMMSAGLTSVIVGAVIGLIPGCGPQIIFVALYGKGFLPFAALLANALSQDGDALFPLLAIDRKSSLWATIITTIPAIVVGLIYFIIEIHFLQ